VIYGQSLAFDGVPFVVDVCTTSTEFFGSAVLPSHTETSSDFCHSLPSGNAPAHSVITALICVMSAVERTWLMSL